MKSSVILLYPFDEYDKNLILEIPIDGSLCHNLATEEHQKRHSVFSRGSESLKAPGPGTLDPATREPLAARIAAIRIVVASHITTPAGLAPNGLVPS